MLDQIILPVVGSLEHHRSSRLEEHDWNLQKVERGKTRTCREPSRLVLKSNYTKLEIKFYSYRAILTLF